MSQQVITSYRGVTKAVFLNTKTSKNAKKSSESDLRTMTSQPVIMSYRVGTKAVFLKKNLVNCKKSSELDLIFYVPRRFLLQPLLSHNPEDHE
jgi:hypothetical protein